MAAVLALTVVPVILLAGLAVSSAFAEASLTGFVTAGVFLAVLLGATYGLFAWFRELDHADPNFEG